MKKISFIAVSLLLSGAAAAASLAPIENRPAKPVKTAKPAVKKNTHVLQPVAEETRNGVVMITSSYGENHQIKVSQDYPNLIIPPFKDPSIKGTTDVMEFVRNHANIIVDMHGKKTGWMSITDNNNPTGTPISLTLIPVKNLKSQTIVVSLGKNAQADRTGVAKRNAGDEYVSKINGVFHDVISGRIPSGYSVRPLNSAFAMEIGIKVVPVEMYSSYEDDIYRYRLTNTTGRVVRLTEENFGRFSPNVKSVLIFPNMLLQPGQTTDVMIMTGKGR